MIFFFEKIYVILILVIKTRKILETIVAKKGLKNYYMQNGILDGILETEKHIW